MADIDVLQGASCDVGYLKIEVEGSERSGSTLPALALRKTPSSTMPTSSDLNDSLTCVHVELHMLLAAQS